MTLDKDQSDDILILSIQKGSGEAFTLLYKKYEGKLMGYLYFKMKNAEIAEEIFQISWTKVLKNIHKYRQSETFSSWLFTIANNSSKDWFKKSHNQNRLLESLRLIDNNQNPEESNPIFDLSFLKKDAKKIIELQYIKGLTLKEISKEIGLGEANVRKISSRAKINIKKHMLNNGGSL